MTEPDYESKSLPAMAEFCLNVPLYTSYPVDSTNEKELKKFVHYDGHIDCYCVSCNRNSIFHPADRFGYTGPSNVYSASNNLLERVFECSRISEHQLVFYFLIHNGTITKIGQHPSLADLSAVEIRKYHKVLDHSTYAEFSKAVGLASHGIGIGAFVYLRRIFERLVEEAHTVEESSNNWNEEQYQNGRMVERISLLKNTLPKFLVDNTKLYSILSKGIHELSEEECKQAFPTTKLGIELILDEKLAERQRNRKIEDASGDINTLYSKLKDGS